VVRGSGFAPDEAVSVRLATAPPVSANATAASAGAWSITLAIPAGAASGNASITAVGVVSVTPATATLSVAALPPPPVANTRAPALSGPPTPGSSLTLDPGQWTRPGLAFAVRWLRDGIVQPVTGLTYTLTAADAGTTLIGEVTAGGVTVRTAPLAVAPLTTELTIAASSASHSAAVPAVIEARVTPAVAEVSVPGLVTVASGAIALASAPVDADGVARLTLPADLAAGPHRLVATYTPATPARAAGATSNGLDITSVAPERPADVATAAITGNLKVGSTVKMQVDVAWPAGTSQAFQWYRAGTPIDGASGATYRLASADRGQTIGATVSWQTADGSRGSASASAAAWPLTAKTVKVAGAARTGSKLTASTGKWGPGTVKLTYRWYKNGKAIKGATKKAYTVKASDAGAKIAVRITGTKAGYTKVSKTAKAVRITRR
jgi:hypothetical protein